MSGVDQLTHLIKQLAAQQTESRVFAYGHISSYDVNLHRVRVTFPALRDEEGNQEISPWMPLSSIWVGNGFGIQIAPIGGEQCIVELVENQHGVHVCANLLYNASSPPPGGLTAGEAIIKHQSGSFLKFHANGDVETNAQGNVNVICKTSNVTASQAANVTAPHINLGSSGENLLDALTSAAATLYNTHTHSGVQTGGGNTGHPNQIMGAGEMTSVVKVG